MTDTATWPVINVSAQGDELLRIESDAEVKTWLVAHHMLSAPDTEDCQAKRRAIAHALSLASKRDAEPSHTIPGATDYPVTVNGCSDGLILRVSLDAARWLVHNGYLDGHKINDRNAVFHAIIHLLSEKEQS